MQNWFSRQKRFRNLPLLCKSLADLLHVIQQQRQQAGSVRILMLLSRLQCHDVIVVAAV